MLPNFPRIHETVGSTIRNIVGARHMQIALLRTGLAATRAETHSPGVSQVRANRSADREATWPASDPAVAREDPVLGIVEGARAEAASGIAEAVGEAAEALAARGLAVVRTVLGAEISPAAAARIAMPLVVAAGDIADRLRAAAVIADLPA